jgi:hypothetical protein
VSAVPRFRPMVESLEDRLVPAITYHGGVVLADVGVEALFLGSGWRDNPALAAERGQIAAFLTYLTNSSYMDMLGRAGYGVGRGAYLGGAVDPLALGWRVTDAFLQRELATDISNGTLRPPDANRLYMIFVEPGVAVTGPFGNSRVNMLGYHSDFRAPTGLNSEYAVLPFPDGLNLSVPRLAPFQSLTKVTSHELAESVTDPQGVNVGQLAWWDDTWRDPSTGQKGSEIADIVEGVMFDLNGYVVQGVVNRQDHLLAPAGAALDPRSAGAHAKHLPRRGYRSLPARLRTPRMAAETLTPGLAPAWPT